MTEQLVLPDILTGIEPVDGAGPAWQLDAATREIGRRGVARARQTLQAARSADRPGTVPAGNLPAAA